MVPQSFLFRYRLACPYVRKIPTGGDRLVKLPTSCFVPFLGQMDHQPEFAEVRVGWNEGGLGIEFQVTGKQQPVVADAQRATSADGMSLWLDTRDTRDIHRASRFCQRFLILPHDGSAEGLPTVRRHSIKRAQEEAPAIDESSIRIARTALDEDGEPIGPRSKKPITNYRMEVFLPAGVLHGFDPESNRRLGFFYRVRDREMGDQILQGAPEMPYWEDPSLWPTLVLNK